MICWEVVQTPNLHWHATFETDQREKKGAEWSQWSQWSLVGGNTTEASSTSSLVRGGTGCTKEDATTGIDSMLARAVMSWGDTKAADKSSWLVIPLG